jgi:hypothetical protein
VRALEKITNYRVELKIDRKSLQPLETEQGKPTITSLLLYEVIIKQLTFCHLGLFSLEVRVTMRQTTFVLFALCVSLAPRARGICYTFLHSD